MLKKIILILLISYPLFSTQSLKWRNRNFNDFYGGELKNTEISSSGFLQTTKSISEFSLKEYDSITAIAKYKNKYYLGTSSKAAIFEFENGHYKKLSDIDGVGVSSLLNIGQYIYASTFPTGKIYKIDTKNNKVSQLCQLEESYVWKLAKYKKNYILAATGPNGKLFKINIENGNIGPVFNVDDTHITALYYDSDKDEVYIGTSEKGLLIKLDKNYNPFTVYDFADREVKVIKAFNGNIYVGTNEYFLFPAPNNNASQAGGQGQDQVQQDIGQAPQTQFRFALTLINTMGREEKIFFSVNEYVNDILVENEGTIYLATSPNGRIYKIDPEKRIFYTYRDLENTNIVKLFSSDQGSFLEAFSSMGPAALFTVNDNFKAEASYKSKVLDTRCKSMWGKFYFTASHGVKFSLRSGNTQFPDQTWSKWVANTVSGQKSDLKEARYFQWMAVWNKENAKIYNAKIYYKNVNQRPIIKKLRIDGVGNDFGGGVFDPGLKAIDDNTVEASALLYELKENTFIKEIVWEYEDFNKDRIFSKLSLASKEYPNDFVEIKSNMLLQKHTWETKDIPDGEYRIKLEISDAPDNMQAESLSNWLISDFFTIDNSKPTFEAVKIKDGSIWFKAVDNFSNILRAEYKIKKNKWGYIEPIDGIFDSQTEEFELKIPDQLKESDFILLRIIDEEGNYITKSLKVK
ncbi:MAG: hypothetical protein ABIA04_11665 [Pseudomonadota bacterium]